MLLYFIIVNSYLSFFFVLRQLKYTKMVKYYNQSTTKLKSNNYAFKQNVLKMKKTRKHYFTFYDICSMIYVL